MREQARDLIQHVGPAGDGWRVNGTPLGCVAIAADDYDGAISHYVDDLGFSLLEDSILSS